MRAIRQSCFAVLATLLMLVAGSGTASAASVNSLAKKLLKGDDFRVRTGAALALGKSGKSSAVKPLCKGLDDDSDSVRAAVAAALGKLQRGGASCLEKRLKKEKSSNVRKMLKKAIRLVGSGGPSITGSTKFYLAIGKTRDKTDRGGRGVDNLVRTTMKRASSSLRGSVVAPRGESADQARKRLRKHKSVDGFLLAPTVHRPQYSSGQLTVKLEVLVYGWPGKNLQGTVSREATMTGVGSKDTAKENQLIQALTKSAMEQFGQLVAQL